MSNRTGYPVSLGGASLGCVIKNTGNFNNLSVDGLLERFPSFCILAIYRRPSCNNRTTFDSRSWWIPNPVLFFLSDYFFNKGTEICFITGFVRVFVVGRGYNQFCSNVLQCLPKPLSATSLLPGSSKSKISECIVNSLSEMEAVNKLDGNVIEPQGATPIKVSTTLWQFQSGG